MGWKSFVRSSEARRKKNEKFNTSLVNEGQKELNKIRNFEDKILTKPISGAGLKFFPPSRWEMNGIEDHSGKITFSFQPKFTTDALTFSADSVGFEKRTLRLISCCISQFGTYLAFNISYSPDVPGKKTTKLFSKTKPECSLIALRSGSQVWFPIDAKLDFQLIPNSIFVGLVAFEPFSEPVNSFEIVFIPSDTSKDDDPEPLIITVSGNALPEAISKANSEKSIMSTFQEQLDSKIKANLSKSGCMIILFSSLFPALCGILAIILCTLT